MEKQDLIVKSQTLFLKVRMGEANEELKKALLTPSIQSYYVELNTDQLKKAFWINVYNAFSYMLLSENPSALETRISRGKHFTAKVIPFADDQVLSLDDIEHGILRKAAPKSAWGGLLSSFRFSHLKKLMVNELDPRIHFALNCGGAGCPAIRYYEFDKIDSQLDLAKALFIEGETSFDGKTNVMTMSQIFNWYMRDFGGKNGLRQLISASENPPNSVDYKIDFKPYDWKLDLENTD